MTPIHGWWLRFPALALLLALGCSLHAQARTVATDEAAVHAAYVVNFLQYAEWPQRSADDDGPLVVLVVGPGEVADVVRQMSRAAGPRAGRDIRVRTAKLPDDGARLHDVLERRMSGVHAVFVAREQPEVAEAVIRIARGRPVLTIGVGKHFVEAGGMLALIREGAHVAFSSNLQAILASPIVVSSKVLKISRPLRGSGPDGALSEHRLPQIARAAMLRRGMPMAAP